MTLNTSARSANNDLAVVYLSSPSTVTLNLSKLIGGQSVSVTWMNPETGNVVFGGYFAATEKTFSTPIGYEDAILVLNISDLPPDTTAPTVAITAPLAGTSVSGTIDLEAEASDNVSVTLVEFYGDGVLLGSDAVAPYSIAYNTENLANGAHSFSAQAFDATGNSATSSPIEVTVASNPPPVTFTANPASITAGASSTLSWTTTNATTVTIDEGIGSVPANQRVVWPAR